MAAPVAADVAKVTQLFEKLSTADSSDVRKAAASDVAEVVKAAGVSGVNALGVLQQLKTGFADKKNTAAREGALDIYTSLNQVVGAPAEPFLVSLLPTVLELCADKQKAVQTAADTAAISLASSVCGYGVKEVLVHLFDAMKASKWQTKEVAYRILTKLAVTSPNQVAFCLSDIVPAVTEGMVDARQQVKDAAISCMSACMKVNGNRDIEPFIPNLVNCIVKPAETAECIHKLAATTFVQQVESPCLSIIVPLLLRGLREPATAIKRKSCLIIENLAKLVDVPQDAVPFLPRLLPGVEKVKAEVADPECANVAGNAQKILLKIQEDAAAQGDQNVDASVIVTSLKDLTKSTTGKDVDELFNTTLEYVGGLCTMLTAVRNFDFDVWNSTMTPFLAAFVAETESESICRALLARCVADVERRAKAAAQEEDEGEDLCNCEFSLAYGAKILLSNTRLHLKRGKRYGLCGPNGVGKSTLMRAIANGQVEGFPPPSELRTVYVEHDIQASLADLPVVDFVLEDEHMKSVRPDLTREEVTNTLLSLGFTKEMIEAAISSLSGGWKMKLALARAMLMKADILLLDEPTNHLDVNNVAWLEAYLISLTQVTSMIVSHDSGFLDHVCSNIIHYEENRKLKNYIGNLSEFVKKVPEAQSYYKLESVSVKFKFPEPGFLEGVKTRERAVLKMSKVAFQYPGTERWIFDNASLALSMASRAAVIGANGAGKSTLIKILTGEMEPTTGTVWKHPNLRIAYVAQHAFHHIESHLDKTPNQYIQWRFATGEDREEAQKVTRQVTEEEEKKMKQVHVVEGSKRQVEKLLGRRKGKKGYEYEVQWLGYGPDHNVWMTRDQLEDMGFSKFCNEIDAKEAARMGLYTRPLTAVNIEKHLKDFGLEPEFATHAHIRGLSGGQKVKLVLGAAMWQQPHLLVLDEPTNYLDRDSLGALAGAIRDYNGGVVMISHHTEFTSALCPETWVVADGKVQLQGQAAVSSGGEKLDQKQAEETTDAFGNTIKVKGPKKKLSNKEKKARDKMRKARRDRGEEVSESEDEDS